MASVDAQIRGACATISGTIDALGQDRNLLSRNLIKQLRDLVEAVSVRLHLRDGSAEFDYASIGPAMDWIGSTLKQTNFLARFHKLLQMSASHYSFEGDASERLMLKYYEYLVRTRLLLCEQCGINVLENLERFPVDLDPALSEYHQKIAERVHAARMLPADQGSRNRFYVHSARPFFVDGKIFYEITFSTITDRNNKFDRIIGFTDFELTEKYAAELVILQDEIQVLGHRMPIVVIREWTVSIRPCEFNNFAKIFGKTTSVNSRSPEYTGLMQFLTEGSSSLLDLVHTSDDRYNQIRGHLTRTVQRTQIFPVLDAARQLIRDKSPGHNVLRYLMLEMRNRVIKSQLGGSPNRYLSELFLAPGCSPFDTMPFCAMPLRHVPHFADLMASIDATERRHEFLARRIRNNVERHGMLYTPVAEVQDLGDVDKLISVHNRMIPPTSRHAGRKIEADRRHVFMVGYENTTVTIIQKLQELARSGVDGYQSAIERWLEETQMLVDDDKKKSALTALFSSSHIALIYGAAGTGKSTMVGYIANYFSDKQKLFLAHTHTAKGNLERRVVAANADFRTIRSHLGRVDAREYDVLVIDECSMVSNDDMLAILDRTKFKLLVLVGDVYQIEAIQFGNWFNVVREFMPISSVFELTKPHRTSNESLLDFWKSVRGLEEGIEEIIAQQGYSAPLDGSIFETLVENEVLLCLNYDGLYGINNVNRFRQGSNPGKAVRWGVNTYKVGDPVLFQDTDRFRPLIYNNLKGRIVDLVMHADRIQFDVWLDRGVTELDVEPYALSYVGDSTVRFDVYRQVDTDDDVDTDYSSVPFQIAYAVSIHKAQGLEYDSVKVVITDANEDDISHSIFYTAITRTREHLKIYWSPETQKSVLDRLEHSRSGRDVALLKARRGLAPSP